MPYLTLTIATDRHRKGKRKEQRRRQQEAQVASLKLSYILTQVSRDIGCRRRRERVDGVKQTEAQRDPVSLTSVNRKKASGGA